MRRAGDVAVALLAAALLAGCGVASGSLKTVGEREFAFDEVAKIRPGMREAEVVAVLGKPTAFGIDERGCEYLHYHRTHTSTRSAMAVGPGVGGATVSQATRGFEVRVLLKDGVVEGVGYTRYAEEKGR